MSNYKKVNEIYNDAMYEFINNRFEKSIEILSQAVELDPGRKLSFVSRGSAYLKLNQLEKALQDFNHAIEIDPEYARAFHLRGLVEEKRGADDRALEDFSLAIEIRTPTCNSRLVNTPLMSIVCTAQEIRNEP